MRDLKLVAGGTGIVVVGILIYAGIMGNVGYWGAHCPEPGDCLCECEAGAAEVLPAPPPVLPPEVAVFCGDGVFDMQPERMIENDARMMCQAVLRRAAGAPAADRKDGDRQDGDSAAADALEILRDKFEGLCALAKYLCIEANDLRRFRGEEVIECDEVCRADGKGD